MMIPLIYVASLDDSFLRAYPKYKSYNAHLYLKVPEYVTVAIYEFCYGIGFIAVELFFRGFLVIGLVFTTWKRCHITNGCYLCIFALWETSRRSS